MVYNHQALYKEILLLERQLSVPVEAPTRTPERWKMLLEQFVDGMLA